MEEKRERGGEEKGLRTKLVFVCCLKSVRSTPLSRSDPWMEDIRGEMEGGR